MYYVTKFDKAVFPNVTSANLCKPIHNVINYFTFIWTWKAWEGREKIQKFEYLKNEKSFLDEIKKFFIFFEGLSFGEKNCGHKFQINILTPHIKMA